VFEALKKINFLLLNFSYSLTKITDFLELDICGNGLRIKKDYLKYMGSDNEIVRGNESKMNYLMTIKKKNKIDGQYMKTIMDIIKYSIFKHYHYHYYYYHYLLMLYDRTLNIKNILNVQCDATIKEKFRIAL
jgi:hypothetical protein